MQFGTQREQWLKADPRAHALLDELFINPNTSIPRAAKLLKVSEPTADKYVKRLASMHILDEVTGRAWGRIWIARPILKALETPPRVQF